MIKENPFLGDLRESPWETKKIAAGTGGNFF